MMQVDPQAMRQWGQLCDLMAERLRTMTPQARHELLQLQMCRARGAGGNFRALRQMTSMLLHTRRLHDRRARSDDC